MIKSFTIINFLGEKIKMELREPVKSGFLIKSVSGLGPAEANINTTAIATSDGSLYNSARLEDRNIVFELIFVNDSRRESIEDVRRKSYKYFPIKKQVTVIVETDKRTVKAIGYVESNEPEIWSEQEGTEISIICPDPYFYSVGSLQITKFYHVDPMFEFPFSNEALHEDLLIFGEIKNQNEGVVTYRGDADVGFTMHIHALDKATNIKIYNLNTREQMIIDTKKIQVITGKEIMPRDDIIINTARGHKSVILLREGIKYNILNSLGRNSDWFKLTSGDNLFAFTADTGTENLRFRIENEIIYEGV